MEKKKVKFGIRAKLIAVILPIVAAAFLALIVIAFLSSRSSIQEKTQDLLDAEGKAGANRIYAWECQNIGVLDTAADIISHRKMSDEEIVAYEENYLGTYKDFPNGIYITYEDNRVLDASGWEPEDVATEGTWYVEGVGHEKFAFGKPYMDAFTKEYIVTASRFFPDLNGQEAVAAADVSLNILSEVVGEMEIAGDGDAFILDRTDGTILAHKDKEKAGTLLGAQSDPFYQRVQEQISGGELKAVSLQSADGTYMVSFQPIEGTDWLIVTRALEKNIYSDIYTLGIILAVVGIVVMLLILVSLTALINRITKPIRRLTDTIVEVTDGNFTADVEVSGNDEVTLMAGGMKQFMSVMRETLGSIISISGKIDDQARDSNQISGELYDSAGGQAEAISQLLQNLQELGDSIEMIAENATTLAMVVADTNDEGNAALENIQTTMSEAENGKESMNSVNQAMDTVRSSMTVLESAIKDVGAAALKIDEITDTIHNIAEQTNLLSLNASIEAARAGEAGRGFAVVATEIRNLAETSASAVNEISELIASVTGKINDTVQQSQTSMEQIHMSSRLVHNASEQFNTIYRSIESTNGIMNDIIKKIHEVNDVANNMAAITQEQSASAEEIEATAENIQTLANTVTDNSANVKNDSAELAETSEDLKEHISKFKI